MRIRARIVEDRIGELDDAIQALHERLDVTKLRYHHYGTTAGPTSIAYDIDFTVPAETRSEARERIREALKKEKVTVHH